jgi:hypothetical protein
VEDLVDENTCSFLVLGIKSAYFCKLISFWLSNPINLFWFLLGLTVLSLYKFLNLLYGNLPFFKLTMLFVLEISISVSMFFRCDIFAVLFNLYCDYGPSV